MTHSIVENIYLTIKSYKTIKVNKYLIKLLSTSNNFFTKASYFILFLELLVGYKSLIEDNVNYRLFSRKNKSVFIHDDSYQLNVLEMHQDLNINNLYILWLKTPKGMDSDLEDEETSKTN